MKKNILVCVLALLLFFLLGTTTFAHATAAAPMSSRISSTSSYSMNVEIPSLPLSCPRHIWQTTIYNNVSGVTLGSVWLYHYYTCGYWQTLTERYGTDGGGYTVSEVCLGSTDNCKSTTHYISSTADYVYSPTWYVSGRNTFCSDGFIYNANWGYMGDGGTCVTE